MRGTFGHVVKLDSKGGARDSEAEIWAHRGVSCTNAGGCYGDWPDNHLASDAADRIFITDKDLRRLARIQMTDRHQQQIPAPPRRSSTRGAHRIRGTAM